MANTDSFVIDIESGDDRIRGVGCPDLSCDKARNVSSVSVDELGQVEKPVVVKNVDEMSPDTEKNVKKDRRKSTGTKKPPKPPRPPRGLSLDAADQKLIKELSELAMIKRARIERMKALKKMKAAKASSASASSSGNLIAMLFTILFCIVILFQGCHSSTSSQRSSSAFGVATSVESNIAAVGDSTVVPDHLNLHSNSVPLSSVEAPKLMELASASESIDMGRKAIN